MTTIPDPWDSDASIRRAAHQQELQEAEVTLLLRQLMADFEQHWFERTGLSCDSLTLVHDGVMRIYREDKAAAAARRGGKR